MSVGLEIWSSVGFLDLAFLFWGVLGLGLRTWVCLGFGEREGKGERRGMEGDGRWGFDKTKQKILLFLLLNVLLFFFVSFAFLRVLVRSPSSVFP